jgi:hypothetical protein
MTIGRVRAAYRSQTRRIGTVAPRRSLPKYYAARAV